MNADASESSRREYAARINRVMDHIQANLAEPMDLEALARIACFSPFHFHRIFHSWAGETLHAFIHRLRLERAAHRLVFDRSATITDIALDCGFSGTSPFARAFKRAYGVSASEWRIRKIRQIDRKPWQAVQAPKDESWSLPRLGGRDTESPLSPFPLEVRVQTLPSRTLAYIRHIGPHMGDAFIFWRMFAQLMAWAGPRGLLTPPVELLSLIHDNPTLTPEVLQRWEAAITVPEGTAPDGPIGIQRLEGGSYATATVRVMGDAVQTAWDALLGDWLPGSGYQPDHRPALAFLRNQPDNDPEGRLLLEIALPVRPL